MKERKKIAVVIPRFGLVGRAENFPVELTMRIAALESHILKQLKDLKTYCHLMTIPCVGKILAMRIVMETGSVNRIAKIGRYASYCLPQGPKRLAPQ